MAEGEFILNKNDGKDTLHRKDGLTERCNSDDIEGRAVVDEFTAEAMMIRGDAVPCQHCARD